MNYKCNKCGYISVSRLGMMSHMRTKHPNNNGTFSETSSFPIDVGFDPSPYNSSDDSGISSGSTPSFDGGGGSFDGGGASGGW